MTDAATMPPKQSIWTRPAAAATDAATAKAGDAKPALGADGKPIAGDAKSATDAKGTDTKSLPDAKPVSPASKPIAPASKPVKTDDGLRNPFAM